MNHVTFVPAAASIPGDRNGATQETLMIPKSFLNNVTNEERLFLRKWKYCVAIVYGIAALWLVGLGVMTSNSKNSVATMSSPAHNPTAEARNR